MDTLSLKEALSSSSSSIARILGLPHLEAHFPTLVLSFCLWNLVQYVISPLLLSGYAKKQANLSNGGITQAKTDPKSKSSLKKRKEPLNGWYTRAVSMLHAVIVIPLAFQCLQLPALSGSRERVFGWDERVGFLHSIACGYFLWDILDAVLHFESIGFVLHGIACLTVFGLSYKPFLAYYGPRFLLWELSTPFLNLNWFFDRSPLKGTTIHFVNGLALLVSFFFARLVYGSYMSYNFYQSIIANRADIPPTLFWVYTFGNILLNGLNWFWFSKMINAVRRRFSAPAPAQNSSKRRA